MSLGQTNMEKIPRYLQKKLINWKKGNKTHFSVFGALAACFRILIAMVFYVFVSIQYFFLINRWIPVNITRHLKTNVGFLNFRWALFFSLPCIERPWNVFIPNSQSLYRRATSRSRIICNFRIRYTNADKSKAIWIRVRFFFLFVILFYLINGFVRLATALRQTIIDSLQATAACRVENYSSGMRIFQRTHSSGGRKI